MVDDDRSIAIEEKARSTGHGAVVDCQICSLRKLRTQEISSMCPHTMCSGWEGPQKHERTRRPGEK